MRQACHPRCTPLHLPAVGAAGADLHMHGDACNAEVELKRIRIICKQIMRLTWFEIGSGGFFGLTGLAVGGLILWGLNTYSVDAGSVGVIDTFGAAFCLALMTGAEDVL